jgi:hypothetical protein
MKTAECKVQNSAVILHSALLNQHLNREPIMTTIVQFVPKWLRARLQKPAPQKHTTQEKKKRQELPNLSKRAELSLHAQEASAAEFRYLWKL